MLARLARDDQPQLRASLAAGQVMGLIVARYVVGLPTFAHADIENLAATVGPVLDHYLVGAAVAEPLIPEAAPAPDLRPDAGR